MKEDKELITLKKEEAIKILKDIEYILCSLHKMGSYYVGKSRTDYEKETTRFIDDSLTTVRLANIRTILSEKFDLEIGDDDMDELERAMQHIPYWRNPGDSFDGEL